MLPVTCNVSATLPGGALNGERRLTWGTGLVTGLVTGIVTVKLKADDAPPPGGGFTTLISSVPAFERSPGSKTACNDVELPKLVTRELPPTSTTEPAEPETKPVPVTVNMSALLPAGRLAGETELAIGCGLLTVKDNGDDVPPPGAGFITDTLRVRACAKALAGKAAWRTVELT